MMNVRYILIIIMLFLTTACSSGGNAPQAEQTQPKNAIQKTVDSFIQPRINALEKAKGLEGKIKTVEKKRLKTIEDFEGKGQ